MNNLCNRTVWYKLAVVDYGWSQASVGAYAKGKTNIQCLPGTDVITYTPEIF